MIGYIILKKLYLLMNKIQIYNIVSKIFNLFFICFFVFVLIFYLKFKLSSTSISPIIVINLIIININIFFWIWVFFTKSSLKNVLIISYFSSIIAIYASEFFISKINKNIQFQYFIKKNNEQNKSYDTRSKFEIYEDLRKKQTISPLYYPYNQLLKKRKTFVEINNVKKEILILSGVSNRKTIVCNESGEYLIYLSDRYGFNNPDNLWNSSSDAIVLGDSMTLGECVSPGKDFSTLLRSETNKSIINLGMGGNGPLFQLAVLKEYYQLAKPDKIIWVYYEGNDLLDLYNEKRNNILVRYFDPKFKQDLHKNQKIIDDKILDIIEDEYNQYNFLKNKSFLFLWNVRNNIKNLFIRKKNNLRNDSTLYNKKIPFIYRKLLKTESKKPYFDNVKEYEKILYQVNQFSLANNIKNYFVYLPSAARFTGEFIDNDKLFARDKILSTVKKFNFEMIDTHEEYFKNQKNPLKYYPYNGKRVHFNSKGYKVISDIIKKNIY
jgi:hypothetical protein